MNRNFAKKKDIVIIAAIILGAMIFWLAATNIASPAKKAVITIDGEIVSCVPLDTNRTFSVPERTNIIFEITDGKVRFKSSDCPDKVCVNSGFLGISGQTSACLPNKTVLKVTDGDTDNASDIDTIIGK